VKVTDVPTGAGLADEVNVIVGAALFTVSVTVAGDGASKIEFPG
jgi:hypothetical protein